MDCLPFSLPFLWLPVASKMPLLVDYRQRLMVHGFAYVDTSNSCCYCPRSVTLITTDHSFFTMDTTHVAITLIAFDFADTVTLFACLNGHRPFQLSPSRLFRESSRAFSRSFLACCRRVSCSRRALSSGSSLSSSLIVIISETVLWCRRRSVNASRIVCRLATIPPAIAAIQSCMANVHDIIPQHPYVDRHPYADTLHSVPRTRRCVAVHFVWKYAAFPD